MTYNILDGGENRESRILQIIQASRPDVIILQEVFTEEFLKSLSRSLGMDYYFGTGNKRRKVALLSKLPVRTFKSYHPLFPTWRNFIDAEVEFERNRLVRIIGVHPIANLGVLFEIWRSLEAQYIISHYRNVQNEPCLIAGDFNAIAPGEKVKTESVPNWLKWIIYLQGNRVYYFSIGKFLSAGFTDCFRFLNPTDDGFTLPSSNPNARLDHIFVNSKMKDFLSKCWAVREPNSVNLASDHCPVIAEFNFPN